MARVLKKEFSFVTVINKLVTQAHIKVDENRLMIEIFTSLRIKYPSLTKKA